MTLWPFFLGMLIAAGLFGIGFLIIKYRLDRIAK